MSTEAGKVVQIIGPVVDVEFQPGQLPNIFNALKISQPGDPNTGQEAIELTYGGRSTFGGKPNPCDSHVLDRWAGQRHAS